MAEFLEQESTNRSKYLKAYFVYGNYKNYARKAREKELEKIGAELNLKNIALTFVPSMKDRESEVNLNKINPQVEIHSLFSDTGQSLKNILT